MQTKSDENWRVGQRCLSEGDVNAAASRLYYGVLQSVLAWARAKKGYNDIHGTHSAMFRYVSSEGHNRRVFGPALSAMCALRETADYTHQPPNLEKLHKLLPTCEQIREYYLKKATVTEQKGQGHEHK